MGALTSIQDRLPRVQVDWSKNLKGQTRQEVEKRDLEMAWSPNGWRAYFTLCGVFNALLIGVLFRQLLRVAVGWLKPKSMF